ncbi:hypothetical protein Tco_1238747 [Tanacetum coccineum]
MATEVPKTLEYRGGKLNVTLVLEVENFTNWKKGFMCYIINIEPQFRNIFENCPYVPMTAGQRKTKGQWTGDERKAANLDHRLKSLILSVLPDDQMNSVTNCLTAKSTWDDLILYHEGPSNVKESRVMDLIIYESEKKKSLVTATPLSTAFFSTSIVQDFQDSPDDEEDTRSSQEYLNDLEEEYQERALLAKSKRFFKKGSQSPSQQKPELRPNKDFEIKYKKVKAKLAHLSSGTSSKSSMLKNKGLVAEAYEWDKKYMSSDYNDMTKVKVLMALADDENVAVGKESARNGKWVKISIRKVHTLLDMEDNDERKYFLDYLCINLNYVEEQRNNLVLKHRDLVQELNTCKEQLLVLKQEKLDFLTMQHVNSELLKENKNLRKELKELTTITETWLNSSNKVNQCISEQIPSQKKRILGLDQLTKDPSNYGQTNLVFVKSSAEDIKVSIPGVKRPWLSEAEGFTLPNHDTSRILLAESQMKRTNLSVVITVSSATEYDSADESSVCSTPLPSLEKLAGVEPVSGPKTIK